MRSGASPTSAAAHGAVTFPRSFPGVSAAYAEFRPRYPDALFAFSGARGTSARCGVGRGDRLRPRLPPVWPAISAT